MAGVRSFLSKMYVKLKSPFNIQARARAAGAGCRVGSLLLRTLKERLERLGPLLSVKL